MTQILLVEDEASLAETLVERLKKKGYRVVWATSVQSSLESLNTTQPDIALVDIHLEDGDGFDVARTLRSKAIPFLFLTAMNSPEFRLEGYEIGADDYIPKPFHFKELLLRLERVLEKREVKAVLQTEHFKLVRDGYFIEFADGRRIPMAKREFLLLLHLVERSPKAVDRDEIVRSVWKSKDANRRSIDNSVLKIRSILGQDLEKRLVSVRGVGYLWSTDVPGIATKTS